jgi:ABC-type sugar transport system substrate-binding protein
MALDHRNPDDHKISVNRRRALARMAWTGAGSLCIASGGIPHSLTLLARAQTTGGTGQAELYENLVNFLQDGTVAALIVQDPFRMGYDGVRIAVAASRGEPVSPHIDTGSNLITKANFNSRRSQELLHPKI